MIVRLLLVISFLLNSSPATASSIFDRLSEVDTDAPLNITLTLPTDSLLMPRPTTQRAIFSYQNAEGELQDWSVKVSLRGKFRRQKCDHAPLKIDFSKKELRAASLADHDKYKLVTSCFHGTASDRLVQKEYLAYRAYQLFTPASYRVRLLTITYRDVNGQRPDRKATAFLIENTDELAERQSTLHVDKAIGLPADGYDPMAEATHALFQYLIGNTDWSNTLALNMKTLENANGNYLPVGYDFDFSGWVKTPYARPREQLGQRSVGQRVYLGFHQTDAVLSAVADRFLGQKEALLLLINNSPLARADRRYLQRYTNEFYTELEYMRSHDIMMIYKNLRGEEIKFIPPGAMPSDFSVME